MIKNQSLRHLVISAFILALLSACGTSNPVPTSGQSIDTNFKLADAIRIYECALNKESDSDKKAKLQEGLNIHTYFKNNEAKWTEDINKNRNLQYTILNDLARKYQCF